MLEYLTMWNERKNEWMNEQAKNAGWIQNKMFHV